MESNTTALTQITMHLTDSGARAARLIAGATYLDRSGHPNALSLAIRTLQDELDMMDTWEGAAREQDDAIRPDYYKFGDVQAIEVSRHLTSNGGQAFQYVVRSTRKDGHIKGDPRENLRKAIFFLEDEIKRQEETC